MAIVKKPTPLPSPLNYVPENSTEYYVQTGDSWYTLAERPDVAATGQSANDLCFFNFKTRIPAEINWYLYHKVGTRLTNKSGKNYIFSTGDIPGRIYLPKVGPPPPANEIVPVNPSKRTNGWFGIGGKVGTQVVGVGIETMAGWVVSLDEPPKGMAVTASISRLGPGFGASGGTCLILIAGVRNPSQLNGHLQGDWDFNVSVGGNWGKIASASGKLKKLEPFIKVVRKLGARTPSGFKKAVMEYPDEIAQFAKYGKNFNEILGIDSQGGPNVIVIDLPIGGGVEVSAFFGVSEFHAVWDNADD